MDATETNHAEEVLDVLHPANLEPTKIMQPGKRSLDSPTSAVAAQSDLGASGDLRDAVAVISMPWRSARPCRRSVIRESMNPNQSHRWHRILNMKTLGPQSFPTNRLLYHLSYVGTPEEFAAHEVPFHACLRTRSVA